MDYSWFDNLFDAYKNLVYRLTYYLCKDVNDADDLFQEVWMSIYKHSDNAMDIKNQEAWILSITMNRFKDLLRKKKVRRIFDFSNQAPEGEAPKADDPFAAFEFQESLRLAMQKLSPDQRFVFVLKHIEGYSQREIGRMMGIPEGTVKSLIFRAIKNMKREMMYLEF